MNNIKLTVAVAIYNIEKYLPKCLESLLNQTEKNGYEILLINDGSTDNSRKICEEFIGKGLNAEIIDKENGGLTSVRNLSVDLAKGENILFLDGDDYIENETMEIIFKELEDYDLLVFGFNWINENNIYTDERFLKNKIYDKNKKIRNLIFSNEINSSVWNKIFKVDILKENNIRFLEFKSCEDTPFTNGYLQKCKNVKIINRVLYQYLYRENSLSNQKKYDFYLNHLKLILCFLKKTVIKTDDFYSYIIKEYVYLIREMRKNNDLKSDKSLFELREKIEKNIDLTKVIFNKKLKFKMKLRYLKLKGRN